MDMGPPLCNPMLLHEIGKGKARLGLEASAALCSKPLDHEEPPVFAHGVAVCHAGDIAGYLVSCHRSSVGLRWPSKRIAALHRLPIPSVLAARCGLRCAPMAARRLRHLIGDATPGPDPMKPFAAIDQGTTSTRVLLAGAGAAAQVLLALRHGQHYPHPGWVEHAPLEIWANVQACLHAAGQVQAIGIANQGESCLAWDARSGAPLSPVIVWQDN